MPVSATTYISEIRPTPHHRAKPFTLSSSHGFYIDLTNANLTGARLFKANLTNVILNGANLTRAFLQDANLTGALLALTDFSGARGLTQAQLDQAVQPHLPFWPKLRGLKDPVTGAPLKPSL